MCVGVVWKCSCTVCDDWVALRFDIQYHLSLRMYKRNLSTFAHTSHLWLSSSAQNSLSGVSPVLNQKYLIVEVHHVSIDARTVTRGRHNLRISWFHGSWLFWNREFQYLWPSLFSSGKWHCVTSPWWSLWPNRWTPLYFLGLINNNSRSYSLSWIRAHPLYRCRFVTGQKGYETIDCTVENR